MWEHVTPSDKGIPQPPAPVLFRIHDPRAVQFWDDERALSRRMAEELPVDALRGVAQVDSGRAVVPWDCITLFAAGRRWEDRFPVPDWAGRPVTAVVDTMRARLYGLERASAASSAK